MLTLRLSTLRTRFISKTINDYSIIIFTLFVMFRKIDILDLDCTEKCTCFPIIYETFSVMVF